MRVYHWPKSTYETAATVSWLTFPIKTKASCVFALLLAALICVSTAATEISANEKDETASASFLLGPGDKLRVQVYGREELSNEYSIRADGSISMPILGSVKASGKDIGELEKALKERYLTVNEQAADIVAEVIERRPFYIFGYVQQPGAYPAMPGMTVTAAVSVARGYFRAASASSSFAETEPIRQGERLTQARETLKGLLMRRARLEAEINKQQKIKVPARLKQLATSEEIKTLLARETQILEVTTTNTEREFKAQETSAKMAAEEIKALGKQLDELKTQRSLYNDRIAKLNKLQKKGLTRNDQSLNAKVLAADAEADKMGVLGAISRAKRNEEIAKKERDIVKGSRRLEAEQELREVQNDIVAQEASLAAAQKIIFVLTGDTGGGEEGLGYNPSIEFIVTRQTKKGFTKISANDETLIQPGDVIKVISKQTTITPEANN